MFSAMKGSGAYLNDRPVHVTDCSRIEGARLVANDYQMRSRRWREPWPEMEVVRFNALAYRIVLVAAGAFDAALAFSRFHEWDVAAADIIVSEAGGRLTDFGGAGFRYNQADPRHTDGIAANPALLELMTAFIAENLQPPAENQETQI
jgi:myo-inositol-1(or 4)-monophosphatase